MSRLQIGTMTIAWVFMVGLGSQLSAAEPTVDLSGYRADCGVTVRNEVGELVVSWPMENNETGRLALGLKPGEPLIGSMGIRGPTFEKGRAVIEDVDPVTFLLVGSRRSPADRPPNMSVFNVFFDTPANRSFQTYRSKLELKKVRVTSQGHRATVAIGELNIGPFAGELRITVYAGAALVHVESVIHTQEDTRAILYDAGLAIASSTPPRFAWMDTEGRIHARSPDRRHRGSPPGRPPPGFGRRDPVRIGGVFPSSASVLLPAQPHGKPSHSLVRREPSWSGLAIRIRHPSVRARRRRLRAMV